MHNHLWFRIEDLSNNFIHFPFIDFQIPHFYTKLQITLNKKCSSRKNIKSWEELPLFLNPGNSIKRISLVPKISSVLNEHSGFPLQNEQYSEFLSKMIRAIQETQNAKFHKINILNTKYLGTILSNIAINLSLLNELMNYISKINSLFGVYDLSLGILLNNL